MQIQTHFQLWEHAPAQKLHEMRRHLRIGAGQGERKLKCYARPVQCRSERTECAEQGVRRSFSGKIQCRRVNSCFGKCGEEVSGSFGKFAEEGGGQFFLRQRCDCADLDIIEGIERFCNEFGRGSVFEQIRGKLDGGKVFRLKKFRKVFGWNFRDAAGNAECGIRCDFGNCPFDPSHRNPAPASISIVTEEPCLRFVRFRYEMTYLPIRSVSRLTMSPGLRA